MWPSVCPRYIFYPTLMEVVEMGGDGDGWRRTEMGRNDVILFYLRMISVLFYPASDFSRVRYISDQIYLAATCRIRMDCVLG